jgi:tetratricopeptide (TPR) repeat protein
MLNRARLAVAAGLLMLNSASAASAQVQFRLRVANAEATARARQFIEYGDARFRHQEFSEAYQRYRKAADSAPNLAEAYFRQGLAQAALGHYRPAVKSLRRGLALRPDWAKSSFVLDDLYADNRAAKEMHLERLALAAEKQPESAELMFLLGVEVFFDGQARRAKTFLRRAVELGIESDLTEEFIEAASRHGKRRSDFVEL